MPQVRTLESDKLALQVSEVRDHLRLNGTKFDIQIAMWIRSIVAQVEQVFKMQITEATWQYSVNDVHTGMDLPLSPIQDDSVIIEFQDEDNTWKTVDSQRYSIVRHRQLSTIRFFPPLIDEAVSARSHYPWRITYKAGFKTVENVVQVPANVKLYLLMLIGFVFATPEGLADKRFESVMAKHQSLIKDYIRKYI